MTVETTRQEVPVGDVRDGARIRVAVRGTKSTVAGVPTLTTEEGAVLTLPAAQLVVVQNEPLPQTPDSVIRASINGGPEETLVLAPNNAGTLRWRRVVVGEFVSNSDVIDNVRVFFRAAPVLTPAPTTGGATS